MKKIDIDYFFEILTQQQGNINYKRKFVSVLLYFLEEENSERLFERINAVSDIKKQQNIFNNLINYMPLSNPIIAFIVKQYGYNDNNKITGENMWFIKIIDSAATKIASVILWQQHAIKDTYGERAINPNTTKIHDRMLDIKHIISSYTSDQEALSKQRKKEEELKKKLSKIQQYLDGNMMQQLSEEVRQHKNLVAKIEAWKKTIKNGRSSYSNFPSDDDE